MVVTRFPAAAATGITQERTAVPSRCTVQAPHWAMPHPNFVPVRPRLSRSTHRSGVSGVTSTDWRLPLTVKTIGGMTHSGRRGSRKLVLGRGRGKGGGSVDVTDRSRPAHERCPHGVDASGRFAAAPHWLQFVAV